MVSAPHTDEPRLFEVLPPFELANGKPLVARLVGRQFEHIFNGQFAMPFDARFGKMMLKTLSHLCVTLGATYGYAERSELSLFAISHGGEARRLLARICGEASAKLSILLGKIATFEAHLYQFDSPEAACNYFIWRRAEAQQDALTACCHHALALSGADAQTIPTLIEGLGQDEKSDLLSQKGIDFTSLPLWQQRGAVIAHGVDENAKNHLMVDLEPPEKDAYAAYLRRHILGVTHSAATQTATIPA